MEDEDDRLRIGQLPRFGCGAHVIAVGGAGQFSLVALVVNGIPLKIGRDQFHPFLGAMCVSPEQWLITVNKGKVELTSMGLNKTCVWFTNGDRVDVAQGETLELHDGCYFGVRYWTNESFVNAPRLALCTFWADRVGCSCSLIDDAIEDTPPSS